MVRSAGEPFDGRISGWEYTAPRAYGFITDLYEIARIEDDPLSIAILVTFQRLAANGNLPVGPRGVGYILLGQVIGGRTVIKAKDKSMVPAGVSGRTFWKDFIDFQDIGDTITVLRRAGLLDFNSVADGRSDASTPLVAVNADEVRRRLQAVADGFEPNILHDQDVFTECWVEAAGLVQLVGRILGPYGISVYSGSGDVPLTALRLAAKRYERALRHGKDVVVMIVGDRDIDGIENADRLVEDVEGLLPAAHQNEITWNWVAPRPQHFTRWATELGPAFGGPKRRGDKILAETMQAEGLLRDAVIPGTNPPEREAILRTILREAVEGVEGAENVLAVPGILDMATVEATQDHWENVEEPLIGGALDNWWVTEDDMEHVIEILIAIWNDPWSLRDDD